MSIDRNSLGRAILVGGLAAGILDAIDAVVAFKVVLGFDPIPIYQFVASGMLGPSAFAGGIATAGVGVGVHFLIAFSAAALFVLASTRLPLLRERHLAAGAVYGVGVYLFMNHVVIPLSLIPPSPFSLPLFLNGVLGHAALVGIPIAWAARRYLGTGAGEPAAAFDGDAHPSRA
ncbi:MAG TPA: hypothetical protein VHE30_01280 [Polyangiaceae bacterium]|nr:hypothetical protein [Polyangiaceae bacterium]